MIPIEVVARYLKVKALAEGAGTTRAEAATAHMRLREMEQANPGLDAVAGRVLRALADGGVGDPGGHGGSAPGVPSASPWAGLSAFLQSVATAGAAQVADGVVSELSGAGRHDPLEPKECALTRRACAAGQVCLEVRVRRRDLRSGRFRDRLLDGVEAELLREE